MISSTDLKLGLRMLWKYPGLALAVGLALAIAIGVGAGWYDFSQDLFRPRIPFLMASAWSKSACAICSLAATSEGSCTTSCPGGAMPALSSS